MNISVELREAQFTDKEGKKVDFYKLIYKLFDGSELELPIKKDKAQMIILSRTASATNK